MSTTSVQQQGDVAAKGVHSRREPRPMTVGHFLRGILAPFASLKLTVTLLVFSMLLVFFGTLAQIDSGIWTVVDQYFWSVWVWVPMQLIVKFGQIFFNVSRTTSTGPSVGFPLPGGFALGWLLFINLVSAHAVRFKMSWKRTGILLVHSGLILLLVGEFITREYAVEGTMTIIEGGSSNYVIDQRQVELAVIDGSKPDVDEVTVVPQSRLRRGDKVHNDLLPFDVTVREFYANSAVSEPDGWASSSENLATVASGKRVRAVPMPVISGTASEQKVDLASAYISLTGRKGEDLGTYLVSTWLSELSDSPDQTVTVNDHPYRLVLRFKRSYKSYTIELKDFRHDVYVGTDTPKNYQSDVRLRDFASGIDRDASIRMNEPMRHQGETFYQSSFLPGDRGTVLQVVKNPGWVIPYMSCVLVGVGMLVQFGQHLYGFISRRVTS